MSITIFTIGYTGFTLPSFLETLGANGVRTLIDTRELPISRKRGFAKGRLSEALAEKGIQYAHFKLLGSPKADRHLLRETGDYDVFFRCVRKHLRTASAIAEMKAAIELCLASHACLMCCCSDWERCHRRCLVEQIATKVDAAFTHLTAIGAGQRAA